MGVSGPTAFKVTSDYPLSSNAGPSMSFDYCDLSWMYTGTQTVSSGFMWTSNPAGKPSYLNTARALTTAPATISLSTSTTVFSSNQHNTFTATCFAQGDPATGSKGMQNLNSTQWEAMNFDEAIAYCVSALTPKVGGPLTSGNSDFGAFTRDGKWNDGSGLLPYNPTAIRRRMPESDS